MIIRSLFVNPLLLQGKTSAREVSGEIGLRGRYAGNF